MSSHSFTENQGQHFDPLDANSSHTVKTERIKNLIHYGQVGIADPFLALQRDNSGGQVANGDGITEGELRQIEATQLSQLENLIAQQQKSYLRMRYVLKETEKRHAKVVSELDEERRKHEHDTAQGDDVTYALEKERTRLKQELETEKLGKKKLEKEIRKLQETFEEEREKHKHIIIMLVEERKKLAFQYVEERKRADELTDILSAENRRIDNMAEGLEEESKKSLQMEAELEKQLSDFDTERQQMKTQLIKNDERINELETAIDKLQREVDHYKKQLQEAHNVAMFQQTLSVSPPRIGLQTRQTPPQLPNKPSTLTQSQARLSSALSPPKVTSRGRSSPGLDDVSQQVKTSHTLEGLPHSSSGGMVNSISHLGSTGGISSNQLMMSQGASAPSIVTKNVQLTATVNSVPVSGPTTGIARSLQPNVSIRPSIYGTAAEYRSTSKNYCESDSSWSSSLTSSSDMESLSSALKTCASGEHCRPQPQVVQISPRVNVSASSGAKVITTTHGGKVTFQVTTNAHSNTANASGVTANGQSSTSVNQSLGKKPLTPLRSSLSLSGPPPVPPNKPVIPPKKDVVTRVSGTTGLSVEPGTPISVEVKPQKIGSQTVKFGITISKVPGSNQSSQSVSTGTGSGGGLSDVPLDSAVLGSVSPRRETAQVGPLSENGTSSILHACVDSLSPEIEHFHQFLSSMTDSSDVAFHNRIKTVEYSPCNIPSTSVSSAQHFLSSSSCTSEFAQSDSVVTKDMLPPSLMSTPLDSPTVFHYSNLYEENLCSQNLDQSLLHSNIETKENIDSHSLLNVSTPLTLDGMTALHLAAQGNNWQSVGVLVRCGASVTSEDDEGQTPAYLALLYACIPAAAALLAYPQCLEHTTKNGCNYMHAAVKSGVVECVQLLIQKIVSTGSLLLLQRLVMEENHNGETPFHIALMCTSSEILHLFKEAGLDLGALISYKQMLLDKASSSALAVLSVIGKNECTCCVWIAGITDTQNWSIGTVKVTPVSLWSTLEDALTCLVFSHFDALERYIKLCDTNVGGNSGSLKRVCDRLSWISERLLGCTSLGLGISSINYYSIGQHSWTKGEYGLVSRPYDLMADSSTCEIYIHLFPLDAVSYSLLVPVNHLKNYLRLIDQNECVVVYGPEECGKQSLVGHLARLWAKNDSVASIDLAQYPLPDNLQSIHSAILENKKIIAILHVTHELWMAVWEIIKDRLNRNVGCVLLTLDSIRKPAGILEEKLLWVQLRHDHEPLLFVIPRFIGRKFASSCLGSFPYPESYIHAAIRWVSNMWNGLTSLLMSLGFSECLYGPLFICKALEDAHNPRDIFRCIEDLWASVLVSDIERETKKMLSKSNVKDIEEGQIITIILQIVLQQSIISNIPLSQVNASKFLSSLTKSFPKYCNKLRSFSDDCNMSLDRQFSLSNIAELHKWSKDEIVKLLNYSSVSYT